MFLNVTVSTTGGEHDFVVNVLFWVGYYWYQHDSILTHMLACLTVCVNYVLYMGHFRNDKSWPTIYLSFRSLPSADIWLIRHFCVTPAFRIHLPESVFPFQNHFNSVFNRVFIWNNKFFSWVVNSSFNSTGCITARVNCSW